MILSVVVHCAAAQRILPPPAPPKPRAALIMDAARDPNAPAGLPVRMIIDMEMRDANITKGPDGIFYLIGTTADPNHPGLSMWEENNGIYMWRSQDMQNWEPMGLIWDLDKDATWSKPHKKSPWVSPHGELRRAVWAPEIHFMKGTWWIPYSMNYGGTGLLKSQSGKPEGPYRDVKIDGPLTSEIDATMFEDDDGAVYLLWAGWWIVRMNDSMTGLAEEPRKVDTTEPKLWAEGSYLRKINGKYYLSVAGNQKNVPGGGPDSYDDYMLISTNSPYGPYSGYYRAIPHGGHNNLFQNRQGNWWSTLFCSDSFGPWSTKPGVLPLQMDSHGRLLPKHDAPLPKWRFTTNAPAADWAKNSFDDAAWSNGEATFGDQNPLYGGPTTTFGSEWQAGELWLRRSFELKAGTLPAKPQLYVLCSGPVEIFVNGELAARVAGPAKEFKDDYQWVPMSRPNQLRTGQNTIAVHGQAAPPDGFWMLGLLNSPRLAGSSHELAGSMIVALSKNTRTAKMIMNIPTRHCFCTLLMVAMLLVPGLALAGGLKVFLLAGQSNMVGNCGDDQDPELIALGAPDTNILIKVFGTAAYGWGPLKAGLGSVNTVSGPEVAFGHDLANALAGQNQVVLIKGAWSGTDLNVRWRPPSSGGTTGDIYTTFVANVRSALAELNAPYELAGICWLQGESDAGSMATANAYQTNLINFIADIRRDFKAPNLPVSISKVMPDSTWTYYRLVRAAQQVVADNDPRVGIFDATGQTISGGHYVLTACSQIGHNFATNMLSMLGDSKTHDDH
ncbi:MAG: sialate O-acetylesterase [Limisphaerales bacterium]